MVKVARTALIELWNRAVKYNKADKVYLNGENNLYPSEIERVVLSSPTASRVRDLFSRTLIADGLINDARVGDKNLSDHVKDVCDDIALQYGSFIHVSYCYDIEKMSFVPSKLRVLDYTKCRIDRQDDNDNSGRIRYQDFTKGKFAEGNKSKWYYPFSSNQDVIIAQIKADAVAVAEKNKTSVDGMDIMEMLPYFRGQVYYLNLTPRYIYALSRFDSVFNDCDTEYRMSVYSNTMTREGFMGKLAVIANGLSDTQTSTIKEEIKSWLGTENSGEAYFLEVQGFENLDNVLKIINVPTQYNDDMFVNTEKRIKRNILGAANNAPEGLIFSNDSSGSFAGADKFRELKNIYVEHTAYERRKIEETFSLLGFPIKIKTFADDPVNEG